MRKTLSTSLLLLLTSILTLSTLPTVKAHTITVDGDPTDWIGTAPTTNTWAWSEGEWIWTDEVGDDTGNGTYTYPTAWFVDTDGVNKSAFTGGDSDLTELRITWDTENVYFLLTFDNITNHVLWAPATPNWLSDPIEADTTAVAICIDTDRVEGSGMAMVDDTEDGTGSVRADILLPSSCLWEYLIEIALGDLVLWWYDGLFVTEAIRDFPCAANVNVTETIEFSVPIDPAGEEGLPDPEGETWALFAFVGSQDYEHFREIASAEEADINVWAAGGGEGFGGGDDTGPDPDAFDCAFFATKEAQEEALNDFDELDPTGYVVMPPTPPLGPSYRETPEFPLPFAFALIAIVVLVASFKLRKKLYT